MTLSFEAPAPARPLLRSAGAVVLLLFALGCERDAQDAGDELGPRVIELDSGRVELPDSIRQLVIRLDRGTAADLAPTAATVRTGDVVRFQAEDAGGHAIAFDGAQLSPEARDWLEATGQMRSPPLVSAGNAWVLNFDGAPPGTYPFTCVTHGASGTLTVTPRSRDASAR